MGRKNSGYVLILSLGCLSLMILGIYGLSSLLRMQLQTNKNYEDIALSEQNAKLGLRYVIDAVQYYLGKDTCVTCEEDGYLCVYDSVKRALVRRIPCRRDLAETVDIPTGGSFKYWIEPRMLNAESAGYLANCKEGGNRVNLLEVSNIEDSYVALAKSYLDFTKELRDGILEPRLQTEVKHGMGPVIEEVQLRFVAHKVGGEVVLKMKVDLALWNPYDVGLHGTSYGFGVTSSGSDFSALCDFGGIKQVVEFSLGKELISERFSASFDPGEHKVMEFERVVGRRKLEFEQELKELRFNKRLSLNCRLLLEGRGVLQEFRGIGVDFLDLSRSVERVLLIENGFFNKGFNPRVVLVEGGADSVVNARWMNVVRKPERRKANAWYRIARRGSEIISLGYLKNLNLGTKAYSIGSGWMEARSYEIPKKRFHAKKEERLDRGVVYDANMALWDRYYLGEVGRDKGGEGLFNVNICDRKDWEELLGKAFFIKSKERASLADQIVVEVEKRGPFFSLGEFVSYNPDSKELGVLQSAINSSGLGYLQEDILEYIGNYIAVRDECLVVHVETSAAECEATVLRGEKYEDDFMGRGFGIVSFFWK